MFHGAEISRNNQVERVSFKRFTDGQLFLSLAGWWRMGRWIYMV